jgi:pimeloyl-ACP methyl ester carboxylesterase
VAAVLDGLLADHAAAVDPDRIALLGLSLGGYLAPRAAAFEDRIAAVVAVDGVYDATSTFYDALGLERDELTSLLRHEPAALADRLRAAAAVSPSLRWVLDHGRYAFGVDTDLDLLAAHLRYNLLDGLAERIRCPVLVCSAEADHFFGGSATRPPEPARLVEHLRAPASLLELGRDRGAEGHCHSGAQRHALARILDWLEESLAIRAPSPGGASLTPRCPI